MNTTTMRTLSPVLTFSCFDAVLSQNKGLNLCWNEENHMTLGLFHMTLHLDHMTLGLFHMTSDLGHMTLSLGHVTLGLAHMTLHLDHMTLGLGHVTSHDLLDSPMPQ